MIFVKADELKKGMRLAKPIYNKTDHKSICLLTYGQFFNNIV